MVVNATNSKNKKRDKPGLWSRVLGFFSKSAQNTSLMSFEIDEITQKFKIVEEAKRLGKLGLPAFHAKDLTSVETEVLRHLNISREEIQKNAVNDLAKLGRDLTEKEHEYQKFRTDSLSAEFERKARQIMDSQGAWLKKLAANAIASIKELDLFREENNIKRQANYPEKSQLFFQYTLLIAMIVVEGVLNSSFFSEGISTGLIGGFIYAASLALINIAGCFFIGKVGVRWINHHKIYGKVIGLVSIFIAILFLSGMAISIAHIREAMASAVDNPTQIAWESMQRNVWGLKDLMSWFLILLTLGFGIAAVVDGIYIDDVYPGYGSIFRRTESAKEEFESEFEEIRFELEDLKQEKLDFIDQQVSLCNELLFSVQKLVEQKQALIKMYQDKIDESEVVLFATLRKFRFENEIVREDGLKPSYFNTMPALIPINLPKLDLSRENELIGKLNEVIRNHERTISQQREDVYKVFEKYVSQLNHLRYY
jgi:hypothetical protein